MRELPGPAGGLKPLSLSDAMPVDAASSLPCDKSVGRTSHTVLRPASADRGEFTRGSWGAMLKDFGQMGLSSEFPAHFAGTMTSALNSVGQVSC